MKRASETPHNNDILKLFSHMEVTLIFQYGKNRCIVKGMDEQLESLVLKKNAIKYRLMYNIDDDVVI